MSEADAADVEDGDAALLEDACPVEDDDDLDVDELVAAPDDPALEALGAAVGRGVVFGGCGVSAAVCGSAGSLKNSTMAIAGITQSPNGCKPRGTRISTDSYHSSEFSIAITTASASDVVLPLLPAAQTLRNCSTWAATASGEYRMRSSHASRLVHWPRDP